MKNTRGGSLADDPDAMKKWALHARTVHFKFVIAEGNQSLFRENVKMREDRVAEAALVKRTLLGRMSEIWNFKVDYEETNGRMSSKICSEIYDGLLSAESEKVSESFVDNAITIIGRAIVPNPEVREISPYFSMSSTVYLNSIGGTPFANFEMDYCIYAHHFMSFTPPQAGSQKVYLVLARYGLCVLQLKTRHIRCSRECNGRI